MVRAPLPVFVIAAAPSLDKTDAKVTLFVPTSKMGLEDSSKYTTLEEISTLLPAAHFNAQLFPKNLKFELPKLFKPLNSIVPSA